MSKRKNKKKAITLATQLLDKEKIKQGTIGQLVWSWGAIGVVLGVLLGGGFTCMTSRLPYIADLFFVIATVLFIFKFYSWEQVKGHGRKRLIQTFSLCASVVVMIGLILLNHFLQPIPEVKRPFFINDTSPKLIFDKNNKIQFLDWYLINSGHGIAADMLGYSLIYQERPKEPIVSLHPQTWVNEFPYGRGTIFHNPSVKMMDLKGKQYAYLYIQYKDKVTKKLYSQDFYFERTIYPNGFIEYSDAGTEHRKEIDKIRKDGYGYVDKLIKEGADIDKIHAALKKNVNLWKDVSEF